ncbi:hypothetical protein TWF102_006502 [Orbilia oligospora]|uniref:Pyridoxal phosphate homeostasis protein n=1 Tax=Orbilia oligospora TaxID=2813651 RepID=A0A7C8JK37_ORBOL|nr:hypothetical protein TWF103_004964 [Orbilia oligospora]KAF3097065.1 hypothetical protein TWF102_006502 [Orbilia oligospora]
MHRNPRHLRSLLSHCKLTRSQLHVHRQYSTQRRNTTVDFKQRLSALLFSCWQQRVVKIKRSITPIGFLTSEKPKYSNFQFTRTYKMADVEYEPGSEAASNILKGLQEKLLTDTELQERAQELVLNIQDIRASVNAAKAGAGTHRRGGDEVQLIAVSKLKPASDILALHSAVNGGQVHFGENYIQELWKKHAILPSTISWHFIGGLQTSSISKLARIRNLYAVHSIDSAKKAVTLNRLRPDGFPVVNVFVQVNTSGEDSKSGVEPDVDGGELWDVISTIRKECPKLNLVGLMTIGAIARSQAAKEGEENEDFVALVKVAEGLERRIGREEGVKVELKLSMGMSDDFESAIGMGAGFVRVGSSIFGARPKKADASIL